MPAERRQGSPRSRSARRSRAEGAEAGASTRGGTGAPPPDDGGSGAEDSGGPQGSDKAVGLRASGRGVRSFARWSAAVIYGLLSVLALALGAVLVVSSELLWAIVALLAAALFIRFTADALSLTR